MGDGGESRRDGKGIDDTREHAVAPAGEPGRPVIRAACDGKLGRQFRIDEGDGELSRERQKQYQDPGRRRLAMVWSCCALPVERRLSFDR